MTHRATGSLSDRTIILRSTFWTLIVGALLLQGAAGVAQSTDPDSVFEASGFQKNRAYFSQLPFENIDMVSGNLMLTFTDLVLPGNAGMDVRVQRTYNRNASPRWSVGLTGIPLRVQHPDGPSHCEAGAKFPTFLTSDGGKHTAFPRTTYGQNYPFPCDPLDSIFLTSSFWRWDRTNHLLQLPNGWTVQYSPTFTLAGNAVAYAEEVRDAFHNRITIEWQGSHPKAIWKVHQSFGAAERVVEFGTSDPVFGFPDSMTFDGRTWTYAGGANGLSSVTPPVGPGWGFDYADGLKVTTPGGGETHYRFKRHQFNRLQPPPPQDEDPNPKIKYVMTDVIDTRTVDGAVWTYEYSHQVDGEQIVVVYPDGRRMTHVAGLTTQLSWEHQDDGGYAIVRRVLATAAGAELEREETTYTSLPVGDDGHTKIGDTSAPDVRTIWRGSHTYTTDHNYSLGLFGDYHRPYQIVESGDAATRTTNLEYDYAFATGLWIKDKTKSQTVSMPGGGSFTSSAEFDDDSGFKVSEARHGVGTTYTPTGEGNVNSATDGHGHTTTLTYDWGVVKNTTTPEYEVSRIINHDGTVASETRRELTTSYSYDALGRLRFVTPALGHAFETVYDNEDGRWIEQRRRSSGAGSWTRFDLDGFGRLVGTSNSVGVQTRRSYDVYGRKTYESQPYIATEHGRTFTYDDLDRIDSIVHSTHGTLASYDYASNGLDVNITEHTGPNASRTTAQDWVASGDPSQARLAAVTDGEGKTFTYGYDTVGNLRTVSQPGGTVRTWQYFSGTELVEWEEHPESGRTAYTYQHGRLATKTDARDRAFNYGYDGNDRLTNINGPGSEHDVSMDYDDSDNRTLLVNGWVRSEFDYDNANNLKKRRDQLATGLPGAMDLETKYWYDLWDNLAEITYPSNRKVEYGHDSEGRIVQVKVDDGVVANVEGHHPTGAVAQLRYGNGIVEQFAYESQDRLENWSGGPVTLGYGYDRQGNVTEITSSNTALNQAFSYDAVDRLRFVTGFGANEFRYDALGNRTYKAAGGVTYHYDDTTKRLQQITGSSPGETGTYAHDAVGNLETDPSATYTYTPFNLVETATVNLVAGGTRVTTYRYDGDNQRYIRHLGDGIEVTIRDAGGQALTEYWGASGAVPAWQRDYVYLGSRLLLAVNKPATGVSFAAAASTTTEASGTHTVTLRLTTQAPLTEAIAVTVATQGGTAVSPDDFTAVSESRTFAIGSVDGTTQTVNVAVHRDRQTEPAETFTLTLSAADPRAVLSPSVHTVTLEDVPPHPGDFDGDGRADLLWQHDGDGRLAMWRMNGVTQLSGAAILNPNGGPAVVADTTWKIVGTGDVDRDGDPDIYWQNTSTGALSVWTMNGLQQVAGSELSPNNAGDINWRVRTVADINNDGSPDLVWQHQTAGWVAVWLMNGPQQLSGHLLSPQPVTDTNWRIVGSGRLDGDAFVDLVWKHETSGDLAWWKLDGWQQVSGAALTPGNVADINWKIRGTTDLDGDGQTDLLWQRVGTGELSTWFMNGTTLRSGELLVPLAPVTDLQWRIVGPK